MVRSEFSGVGLIPRLQAAKSSIFPTHRVFGAMQGLRILYFDVGGNWGLGVEAVHVSSFGC